MTLDKEARIRITRGITTSVAMMIMHELTPEEGVIAFKAGAVVMEAMMSSKLSEEAFEELLNNTLDEIAGSEVH